MLNWVKLVSLKIPDRLVSCVLELTGVDVRSTLVRQRRHREMEAGPVFHATVWCGESPGEPLPSPCLGLLADSHTVQYCTVMKHRITLWCRARRRRPGIGCVVKHRNAASHRTKPERLVPARHGRLCSLCSESCKARRHLPLLERRSAHSSSPWIRQHSTMLPRVVCVTSCDREDDERGAVVLLVRREMTGCVGASNFA